MNYFCCAYASIKSVQPSFLLFAQQERIIADEMLEGEQGGGFKSLL